MPADLWQHLLPPFDAWWPNIIASIVWGIPAFVGQHLALRRAHRRGLDAHLQSVLDALEDPPAAVPPPRPSPWKRIHE